MSSSEDSAYDNVSLAAVVGVATGLYLFFLLWNTFKLFEGVEQWNMNASPGKLWIPLVVAVVIMVTLFIVQLAREIRVKNRVEYESAAPEDREKMDVGSQNFEVVADWPQNTKKSLNGWEMAWGSLRSVVLLTVIIMYIVKKFVKNDNVSQVVKNTFKGDSISDLIAQQLFDPDNLPFIFMLFILVSAFITRQAYLNDQFEFDKMDTRDDEKGGSRIVKAEADFSLAVIFGAPLFVLFLLISLYEKEHWKSGAFKSAIFFGLWFIWMLYVELNRKADKTWGFFGIGWGETKEYPNPDTFVGKDNQNNVVEINKIDQDSISEFMKKIQADKDAAAAAAAAR